MFEIAACANFVFETAFNIAENHKSKMHSSKFHNPECLLPDQYQSRDGWRLLLKTELRAIPFDSQVKSGGVWRGSDCQGYAGDDDVTYRTRAPLPVEDNGWVKMSERKPTKDDLPAWVINSNGYGMGPVVEFWRDEILSNGCFKHLSHWMSVNVPALPQPKAMTREEDHKAFSEQYAKLHHRTMWDAALAYERAKYRALVDRYNNSDLKAHEFIHAVAEMCK